MFGKNLSMRKLSPFPTPFLSAKTKAVALLLAISPLCTHAQIKIKGYKCKYYEDQIPNTMADMYSKNDTLRFDLFSRDIAGAEEEGKNYTPEDELKMGLLLCFAKYPYSKTKDNLYVSTGVYKNSTTYYYLIYVPEQQISLSVRSGKNDSSFSDKSKWLLQQIREARKKKGEFFLMTDKGETCQVPDAFK